MVYQMKTLIFEIGIMLATGVGNSDWGKLDFQKPYLLVQRNIDENFFVLAYQTSRTNSDGIQRFNPKTALWKVGGGYTENGFTLEFGHQSEHNLFVPDSKTESFNYLQLKYREEF